MRALRLRFDVIVITLCAFSVVPVLSGPLASASCGATTCFLVIGSIAGLLPKGTLTANFAYNYVQQQRAEDTSGRVPGTANISGRVMVLDAHREIRTISQLYTLDLNYGVTDRFGLQLTIPTIVRLHRHTIREGLPSEDEAKFTDDGLGDIRVVAKYNVFPRLRRAIVLGAGVELPTGKNITDINKPPNRQLPGVQLGRGQLGLIASLYQTYQIIPNRLSQFASASYRHTFRNNEGYQFGDEYILGAGLEFQALSWLGLNGQFNYRYVVHDNFSSSLRRFTPGVGVSVIDPVIKDRRVPNSGHTILMFTPGFTLSHATLGSLYFNAQIPVVRDFNGNLEQGTSFLVGLTTSFNLTGS